MLFDLNPIKMLNFKQLVVYNLIINYYKDMLIRINPEPLLVNFNNIASINKTYMLL